MFSTPLKTFFLKSLGGDCSNMPYLHSAILNGF